MLALALLLAVAPADDRKAKIDPLVQPLLAGKKNAAVAVGVWRDGRAEVFGYGTAHTRLGDRTPDGTTVFAIGSVTKTFAGVLLAEAVRRGEVKLDDPVNAHLPADLQVSAKGDKPVTLLHLATHRSGLPVQPQTPILMEANDPPNAYADFGREKLARSLFTLKPANAPGERYVYSNLGAGLVGHALVHAAKAPSFDHLLKERVCQPLGMGDTAEALTGEQRARRADGFTDAGEAGPHWEFATLVACGGLFSTADDLLKYAAASMGDGPLAESFALATKPREKAGRNQEVGLFWMTSKAADKPAAVWHNGATYVCHAMIWTVPADKLAVVVLSARDEARVDGLAAAIADALRPKEPKP